MAAADLEEAARQAVRAGAEAWPGVVLGADELAAWAASQDISAEALAARGPDLYLAAACTRGDSAAMAAFDRAFLQAPGALGRARLRPEQMDELRQVLRVRLLAGPAPRIATFRGAGPLGAWVRVAAAREAGHLLSAERGTGDQDGALMDALADLGTGANPELVSAQVEHREAFRAALADCLQKLGAREKTLLRMNFLDQMNIEEIGVVYRVHRATVARWLVAIRTEIFQGVCDRLSITLRSSPSEVASLVRLVRSEVDLSIRRLLAEEAPTEKSVATRARPKTPGHNHGR